MKVLVLLLGLACVAQCGVLTSSLWAVLVAGSKDWLNYRHQADVCHAYHTLIAKGVHPDRIIVLMYDDIANNQQNEHKGKIFNKPNGADVYAGVKIDYRKENVTIDTFKKVLLGDKEGLKGRGSGRVLESGPNDHVFINFVDHGQTGGLIFPSEILFANDFIQILKQMKKNEKYGEMVLYIEACEAGSMFDNLLGRYDNIIALTASAPDESSYAWYCMDDGTCLGDLYSITWMERLDKMNYSESVFEQFDVIRTAVLGKSHVNLYGDYRLGFVQFGNFGPAIPLPSNAQTLNKITTDINENDVVGVSSWDVPLHMAQMQIAKAEDSKSILEKIAARDHILESRSYGSNLISEIISYYTKNNTLLRAEIETTKLKLNMDVFDCYKSTVTAFEKYCYKITKHTFFLQHMYKFANACVLSLQEDEIVKAIRHVCQQRNQHFDLII